MKLAKLTEGPGGYIYDPETNERVIFYECDPAKNFLCDRAMCRAKCAEEGEDGVGFCSCTPEPRFRKKGGRAFYKRWNGEYYGREYIDEGGTPDAV